MFYISSFKNRFLFNKKEFSTFLITGTFTTLIILELVNPNTFLFKSNMWIWKCAIRTKNPVLQKYSLLTKGESYVLSDNIKHNVEYRKTCIVTTWNIVHYILSYDRCFSFPTFLDRIVNRFYNF
jgi:hypothetical protein